MEEQELKKLSSVSKAELSDEDVSQITGGYSKEHWEQMTQDERVAAYTESKAARAKDGNAYCAYYDPNA